MDYANLPTKLPAFNTLCIWAAQRLGSAATRVRDEHLRNKTNYNAREAVDLRARSAVRCNRLLGGA